MISWTKRAALTAAVGAALAAAAAPTQAQSPAEFFKGKTVTINIGYGPGGGYDTYARVIASHIGRHIPGNPSVNSRNVPGAGSIKLANQLFAVSPKDGTATGMIGDVLALKQALGQKGIQFKADQFNWIGRISDSNPLLIVWHTSPVETFEDAKKTSIPIGVPGAGSATTLNITAINNILGTKFRLISGYGGSAEIKLALERGEVQGTGSVLWELLKTQHKDWLEQKKIRILYQVAIQKQPDLPDVPSIIELGRTDEDKRLLRLFSSYTVVGRSLLVPPGVPKDRVVALRDAFAAMMKDPALKKELADRNLESAYMSGADLQTFMEEIASLPAPLLERARAVSDIKVEKRKGAKGKKNKKAGGN
ncbi:MAG: Bug family tripartite tricarboxylate transporter substrate binding protein [Hyphomicrobiaceae bacterium]